ncbi:MAG TPA: VWA domain-containing protein, partial [Thermoanaerobaculia bacterium]|nr:VWA domain-containing protein [Thermoanaerobaculia bacterium]
MRGRSRSLRLCIALLVLVPLLSGADKPKKETQETTVREEASVTLIEVPVNVTDKDGRPVENLKAEDFEVYDDGKKQTITGFDVLDERGTVVPPSAEDAPVHPAARRHFLILFDLTFGSPRGIVLARRAARDFVVNRMKDLDLAAVATYSVENGLRLLVTFSGDRAQLASAIDTLGFPTLSDRRPDPLSLVITEPSQSNSTGFSYMTSSGSAANQTDSILQDALENMQVMVARSQRAIYRDRVGRLLDSFAKMARALDAVQGRKHILYLSEGFDSRELSGSTTEGGGAREAEWVLRGQSWKVDSDTRFGNSGLQEKMKNDLELFNRSDCIIHSIDIGGLRAASDPAGSVYNTVNGQEALFYFSDQTGGEFLRNSNDLSNSFDKLLDRTGLIYILAFQPVRVPENGKFHPIRVKVKGNYRVSHRTGYYEPKSQKTLSPIEKTLAQSEAITAALPKTDIPTWVLAAPLPARDGLSRVPVIVEIPGDRLLASHDFPNMNVDIFVYAIDKQGKTHDYLVQPVGIELSKAAAALAHGGIKYYGLLNLAPGDYTLRTLVRDNETGRFGVSVTPVKVPAGSEPLSLPPLFLEEGRQWIMIKGKPRSEADAAAEYPFAISGDSFVPTALAGLKNGEKTRVCLIAYNFPPAAEAIGYTGRILGVDGQQHGKLDLKLLEASDREREAAR